MKPDICLYRDDVIENFKKTEGSSRKTYYVTDFAHSDVWSEVKKDDNDDPFLDPTEITNEENAPGSLPNQSKPKVVGGFFRKSIRGKLDTTIGQFAAYAMSTLTRQHRTHCFSIGVFGSKARFFRWDRAGVIISRAFDYKEKALLSEFAKRYCQATDAQRGYDMTVCKATDDEEKIFKEKIEEHVKDLYGEEDALKIAMKVDDHYQEDKVFKIKVMPQHPNRLVDPYTYSIPKLQPPEQEQIDEFDDIPPASVDEERISENDGADLDDVEEASLALESIGKASATANDVKSAEENRKSACRKYADVGKHQYFLVSRPVAVPLSVAGRSTRGYWSVKIPDKDAGDNTGDYRICFLKDTWRIVAKDMDKEGDIMVELYEAGVEYISDILCHGDVELSEDDSLNQSSECMLIVPFSRLLLTCNQPEHRTKTNEYVNEAWNSNKLGYTVGKYTHYRMISVEVGCLLRELFGAYELFEATRMAFIGVYAYQ